MTDPSDALASFQALLSRGKIDLRRCRLDPSLYAHKDEPVPGVVRLTYVGLDGLTVTAMAMFVSREPLAGRPCFAVGYAVPEIYRGQGRAKDVVKAAIAELEIGFGRTTLSPFYLEAVVGADNESSRRIAAQTISEDATAITDCVSGLPAFRYVCKIG